MDEHERLHAAIREHLRRHNPRAIRRIAPPVPLALTPCTSCGRPIMAGGPVDLGGFGPLLAARRCVDCYLREAA